MNLYIVKMDNPPKTQFRSFVVAAKTKGSSIRIAGEKQEGVYSSELVCESELKEERIVKSNLN
jgi:hypothetical protein